MKKQNLMIFFAGVFAGFAVFYFGTHSARKKIPEADIYLKENLDIKQNTIPSEVHENLAEDEVKAELQPMMVSSAPCPADLDSQILPAPEFEEKLKDPLETNHEGEVRVAWKSQPRALRYSIIVKDLKGKVVKSMKTSQAAIYLKEIPFSDDLPMTPYVVQVSAINKKGIDGPKGKERRLMVRRMQNILAPTIKTISIED
jgi:hypothetical protein